MNLKVKALVAASLLTVASAAGAQIALPGGGVVWLPVQGTVNDVEFPSRDRSYMSKGNKGDFINIDNLRQMKRGLSKQEVRRLLGAPHFGEGIMGVSKWNYIFNFRNGVGDEYVTCQYQVIYAKDPHYNVESMHWDSAECPDLLNRRPAEPAPPAPLPPPAPAPRKITLSADALFHFDKSGMGDILPKGKGEVIELSRALANEQYSRIQVIGYTDRFGTDEYNAGLSQRRGVTIRQLMIDNGIDASRITSAGAGESSPVTDGCWNVKPRAETIKCLQPDRRVEIIVYP